MYSARVTIVAEAGIYKYLSKWILCELTVMLARYAGQEVRAIAFFLKLK